MPRYPTVSTINGIHSFNGFMLYNDEHYNRRTPYRAADTNHWLIIPTSSMAKANVRALWVATFHGAVDYRLLVDDNQFWSSIPRWEWTSYFRLKTPVKLLESSLSHSNFEILSNESAIFLCCQSTMKVWTTSCSLESSVTLLYRSRKRLNEFNIRSSPWAMVCFLRSDFFHPRNDGDSRSQYLYYQTIRRWQLGNISIA